MDCPRCGHPSTDHPRNARGERYCSVGLNELPSCRACREYLVTLVTVNTQHRLMHLP